VVERLEPPREQSSHGRLSVAPPERASGGTESARSSELPPDVGLDPGDPLGVVRPAGPPDVVGYFDRHQGNVAVSTVWWREDDNQDRRYSSWSPTCTVTSRSSVAAGSSVTP